MDYFSFKTSKSKYKHQNPQSSFLIQQIPESSGSKESSVLFFRLLIPWTFYLKMMHFYIFRPFLEKVNAENPTKFSNSSYSVNLLSFVFK